MTENTQATGAPYLDYRTEAAPGNMPGFAERLPGLRHLETSDAPPKSIAMLALISADCAQIARFSVRLRMNMVTNTLC